MGDSFCFGQGVPLEKRLTEIVEKTLVGQAKDWQLANICKPGMDTLGNLRRLVKLGPKLPRIDKVIYVYVLNDPIAKEELASTHKLINDLMHYRDHNRPKFNQSLWQKSALLMFFHKTIINLVATIQTESWYHDLHFNNRNWHYSEQDIISMKKFADSKDAEFHFVVFPLIHKLDKYPFLKIHHKLRKLSESNGLNHIDLFSAFEGKNEQELWVHPTDYHPNQYAHDLAAETLLREIDWE